MPFFFIIIFALYILGNVYIYIRGRKAISFQSTGVKRLLSVLYWIGALLFIIGLLLRNYSLPQIFANTMFEAGTGWLVFTLYMVILLGVFDILKVFRVRFKYSFYVSLGLTLSALWYGYYNYQHPKLEVINIVINKPYNGYQQPIRIVAVSDIHLGYGTDKKQLKQYVNLINAQNPDLILIGGDLIDNSVVPLKKEKMEEELSNLLAPMGTYMVPGNHEYISGIKASEDFIHSTPIHLLKDTVIVLPGGLQIIGRDDRHNSSRKQLSKLVQNINPQLPVILLDHQPYDLDETVSHGIDLQFSGHTHQGQVWPISLLVNRIFELGHGYMQKKNTHIYVSSGLSLWGPPFRIGTNSELVVFNISFKEN